MPIHDLGYRGWSGRSLPNLLRFWVIATSGVRVVGRNAWVRRILLAAWLPTFALAAIIFGYERMLEERRVAMMPAEARQSWIGSMGEGLQDGDVVVDALTRSDPRDGRHPIWSWLLCTFLRAPQAGMAMLVIGMIAPPLIARDVRTRAFLLYFAKPLGRGEYVFGKFSVIGAYLMSITMVPALGCYLFAVALSSELAVVVDTWDLPLRVVIASLIFIIPAASIALMFSSLTAESRFAAFAWFAFWGLGFVAWSVTYGVLNDRAYRAATLRAQTEYLTKSEFNQELRQAQAAIEAHPMALVSLYHTLVRLQRWVFGLEQRTVVVIPSAIVAGSITLLAWIVMLRRVVAPIHV